MVCSLVTRIPYLVSLSGKPSIISFRRIDIACEKAAPFGRGL